MKWVTTDKHGRFIIGVPKKYVISNLKIFDEKLTSTFFVVYCLVDEWRTYNNRWSFYKSSILNILEDIGKPYNYENPSKLPTIANEIVNSFEFMEREGMIDLIEGDYHNPFKQFVIQIIPDKFVSNEFVSLPLNSFKAVLRSNSSLKKGNLLHVLLYALSPVIAKTSINPMTCETEYTFYQVYSESNKQTSAKIGISDKTIEKCLAVLSGDTTENKPLVIYRMDGFFQRTGKNVPNIYTDNYYGWKTRIKAEIAYYEENAKKQN